MLVVGRPVREVPVLDTLTEHRQSSPIPSAGSPGVRRRIAIGPWRLAAFFCALGFALATVHPFRDVDVYWHVLIGGQLVETMSLRDLGSDWSYVPAAADWTTTQWLSEVLFYALHHVGGWQAIAGLQMAVAMAIAGGSAVVLLRGHRSPLASVVYVLLLFVLLGVLQERPALLSMLLLVWLTAVAADLVARRPGPRLRTVFLVTAVWANLHGLWVLVPAVLGLVTAGRLAERDGTEALRTTRLTGIALLAGCLTPVGPALLLSPIRVAGAAAPLREWQPTTFGEPLTVGLALIVLLILVAWARGTAPVPATEVLYVVGLVVFACMAMRNVPPAALLLAPVVIARLEAVFPRTDDARGHGERRALIGIAVTAVLATAAAMTWQAARTPTLPSDVPVGLARVLAAQPGEHRTLNDYNVSGALLFWGGPNTSLVIDGRADRYGADRLERHKALMELRGDWQETLDRYDADYALLRRGTPLLVELSHRGWRTLAFDDHHTLLKAPSAAEVEGAS